MSTNKICRYGGRGRLARAGVLPVNHVDARRIARFAARFRWLIPILRANAHRAAAAAAFVYRGYHGLPYLPAAALPPHPTPLRC